MAAFHPLFRSDFAGYCRELVLGTGYNLVGCPPKLSPSPDNKAWGLQSPSARVIGCPVAAPCVQLPLRLLHTGVVSPQMVLLLSQPRASFVQLSDL